MTTTGNKLVLVERLLQHEASLQQGSSSLPKPHAVTLPTTASDDSNSRESTGDSELPPPDDEAPGSTDATGTSSIPVTSTSRPSRSNRVTWQLTTLPCLTLAAPDTSEYRPFPPWSHPGYGSQQNVSWSRSRQSQARGKSTAAARMTGTRGNVVQRSIVEIIAHKAPLPFTNAPPRKEDTVSKVQLSQIQRTATSEREFKVGECVMVRDYQQSGNDKWRPAVVSVRMGTKKYLVSVSGGGPWKRHADQMMKQNGSAFQEEETEEIEPYVETGSTNKKREEKKEGALPRTGRQDKSDSRITEETGTSDRALVMPQG
ncbi:hypothetical protein EMCRGX_G033844 [Ephydatia muelleri]